MKYLLKGLVLVKLPFSRIRNEISRIILGLDFTKRDVAHNFIALCSIPLFRGIVQVFFFQQATLTLIDNTGQLFL